MRKTYQVADQCSERWRAAHAAQIGTIDGVWNEYGVTATHPQLTRAHDKIIVMAQISIAFDTNITRTPRHHDDDCFG